MVIKLGGTICCDVSASHEAYHSQSKGFNGFHISEGSPWPCWPLRSKQLGVVRFIDFCKRSQLFTADEASQVWKMLWASWECLFDCGIRMHQNARSPQPSTRCFSSMQLSWVSAPVPGTSNTFWHWLLLWARYWYPKTPRSLLDFACCMHCLGNSKYFKMEVKVYQRLIRV